MVDNKCILLLSGGLDSSALYYWAIEQQYQVLPILVNYGQPSYDGEKKAFSYLVNKMGCNNSHIVNIADIVNLLSLDKAKFENYFPSRNILLLIIASIVAYNNSINKILIGLIKDSSENLPDCSEFFINYVEKVLNIEHTKLRIMTPFISRSKKEIITEAINLGLNPKQTFCCNIYSNRHCWHCSSCIERYNLFKDLNLFNRLP